MAHRLPAPSTLEDRRKLLIKTVSSRLPSTKGKDWKKSSLYWLSGLTCRGWTFRSKFGYHKRHVSMAPGRKQEFQIPGCNIKGEDDSGDSDTGAGLHMNASEGAGKLITECPLTPQRSFPQLINANFPVGPNDIHFSSLFLVIVGKATVL